VRKRTIHIGNPKETERGLRRAHEHGNVLAKYDALQHAAFVRKPTPEWAVRAILDDIRRLYRRKFSTAQARRVSDWMCWDYVRTLCDSGLSQRRAWRIVGQEFHVSPGAVRAACTRSNSPTAYFSTLMQVY